jgi:branched-chain amino acid transport system substrate-binding protein
MYPRASRQFDSVAKFLADLNPKPATASFISTIDGYGRSQMAGAIDSCEKQGIKMLEKYELPEKIGDFSSVLTSVRANTPDILVTTLHDQETLLLTRQMISTNTNVKMLFEGLGPQLASFREAMGKYATGITMPLSWDERLPYKDKIFGDAKSFAEYYRTKFTRPITHHVAGGAACVLTYILAMQDAKSTTDIAAIRKALAAANYETFYANIKFTEQGDGDPISMGFLVGQVQRGELSIVSPDKSRTDPTIYPIKDWMQKS